jgi:hypothetical protein
MKMLKYYFLIYLLFTVHLFSQTDTIITSMKGFKGNDGSTYLVYQTKQTYYNDEVDSTIFGYYLYNVNDKTNHLIDKGFDKTYYSENHLQFRHISDIKFINNVPTKYIYYINTLGIDPDSRIIRSDTGETLGLLGFIDDLFISSTNPQNIFAVVGNWILRSFDGGLTWPSDSSFNINDKSVKYLSFFPFEQSKILGINSENHLVKSLDFGKTFSEVSTISDWNEDTKLYFDKDQKHIYAVTNEPSSSYDYPYTTGILWISDNFGNLNNWETKKIVNNRIDLCLDDSISGNIFISVGNKIYQSNDYGNNFTQFVEIHHHANGLYKAPNENILYASNSNGILEITSDTTEYVIKKSIKKSLELFPLAVGNKWIYNEVGTSYDPFPRPFSHYYTENITKDTIDNIGNHYYYFESDYHYINWIRIDSLTGKVYGKYELNDNEEYLFTDLNTNMGDENEVAEGIIFQITDSDTLLWDKKRFSQTHYFNSLYTYKRTFTQGIGITEELNSFDFGNSTTALKGCIINGILYGDTIVVGINDVKTNLPMNFELSQNYPNPFNPTTIIEYSIPANLKSKMPNVQLTIYDVLGREIKTLVNQSQKPGNYKIDFDGSNLSSGIYYYQLKCGSFMQTKKMILLK